MPYGPEILAKNGDEQSFFGSLLRGRLASIFHLGRSRPAPLDLDRLSGHMLRDLNLPDDVKAARERLAWP